jgi:Spy/CpxP family protein refolding chaperone
MKFNKLTLIAVLALGGLVVLSPGAIAQDTTSTNMPSATTPRRGRMLSIDQMVKALALTDEQKTNVQTTMDDMRKKMAEVRQDSTLSMEDRRAKAKEIREALTAKMKEILTPEQFAKYQTLMPARRPTPTPPPSGAN